MITDVGDRLDVMGMVADDDICTGNTGIWSARSKNSSK